MDIAVLGTGNMGKALISALLGAYGDSVHIFAHDENKSALEGVDARAVRLEPSKWDSPDALIICIKPAGFKDLLPELKTLFNQKFNPLVISVAAGVSISFMKKSLGETIRVCRGMPNTPAIIAEGMSAYSMADNCSETDWETVSKIFSACGKVLAVDEKLMDAITGLSGSGPAYVYTFIEALAEGGVAAGLSFSVALEAAVQTVIGAARMVEKTNEHPSVLKSRVVSPGGTTASALMAMEQNGFKHSVMNAVLKAAERSKELTI